MDQKFRRAGWPFSRYSLQAPDWGELQSKFRRGILCRNRRPAFKKDRSRTGSVDDTRLLWLAAESRSQTHRRPFPPRSEEHTSELQSLMRKSYAVFCLKKK